MTPYEFKQMMEGIFGAVPEREQYNIPDAHQDADELMIEALADLGYGDGVDLFIRATKWYE